MTDPACRDWHRVMLLSLSDHRFSNPRITRLRLIIGVGHAPDFSANMTTLAAPTARYIDVPPASYEAYDSCRFPIPNESVSGAISVNDIVGEEQQVLSFDNAAPVGDLKVSLQSSAATTRF